MACSTLDICVQQLTLEDLSAQIIELHERGTRVRVICEKHMAGGTGSQVKEFIEAGRYSQRATNNFCFVLCHFFFKYACILSSIFPKLLCASFRSPSSHASCRGHSSSQIHHS